MFSPRLRRYLLPVSLAVILASGVALACQVPVFRFALERWEADPYQVTVFPGPSGTFSETEQAAIDYLESQEPDRLNPATSGVAANLDLEIAAAPAEGAATAKLRVTYPQRIRGYEMKPIWEGELTLENARRLIDSPTRRELAKRLLAGESAVWLVVEGADAAANDAAVTTLEEAIGKAKETLRIPDGVMTRQEAESAENFAAVNSDDILRSHVPLKIDFSVLRISRDDPAEALFLPMVLNIEDDLGQYAADTMVFPVFGRGRLLEPLIERGIHVDNVMEYGAYICGACSCEVKDQNPGLDLLVAADWETALHGSEVVIDKVLPPLEGTGILTQAAAPATSEVDAGTTAETNPEPATESAEEEMAEPETVVPMALILGLAGILVVILGFGTFLILRRQSP